MNIQRAAPANELLAKLIFLMLPTAVMAYRLLQHLEIYYTYLQSDAWKMATYFAMGMAGAAIFYAFRFRFLPTFLLLLFGFYFFSKGIDKLATGEFDGLKIHVSFIVFAVLFTIGWLNGWGFLRMRYWSIGIATAFLVISILLIAKAQTDSVHNLLWSFGPAVLYSVYIIFAAEQIYSYRDKNKSFWWFLTSRLVGFMVVALLLFGGVVFLMRGRIKETVASFGGGGKGGTSSMLKGNKDGTFDLKDYSQLRSALSRNNEFLFCAHIDNFFGKTDVPNPLYLTAFYYTKFDTSTETFERDSLIPQSDLFEPDPSQLSLFQTKTDSTVIKNSGTKIGGKEVEIQVYSKKLSPSTYLAPHTGYFVQPITIEKEFRDSFKTAFRAKSYVSELNSAYFVYNVPKSKSPEIALFQEKRFEILRKATDYSKENAAFMRYYTFMPSDAKFQAISNLAHDLTKNAKTPVDKVIAIRDYFLSKGSGGQPLFKYTDNPGVPDIPSASKLQYFLFQNRKGYCAYFAGATLFMLRSLGIPSRIVAGFLTEDRSGGKNKGWYYYYADQAHAWVQVYFPGYGWLDFDTTIGNDEARESPRTDGTPPTQPPHAWLAAEGVVVNVDTTSKKLMLAVRKFVFHDKEYKLETPYTTTLDMHVAAVQRDSVAVPLSSVQKGEPATAVSYAEAFKDMSARDGESGNALIKRFPNPEPIDELYLKRIEHREKQELPKAAPKPKEFSWKKALIITGILLLALILLFFLIPTLLYQYYKLRARNAKDVKMKSYWTYRAALFYVHQLGYNRGRLTPLQYARNIIDPTFRSNLTSFMNIYLKQKFANLKLNDREVSEVNGFLQRFVRDVNKWVSGGKRFAKFLNPLRAIQFFFIQDENEEEKQDE